MVENEKVSKPQINCRYFHDEINKLNPKKASETTDIQVPVTKENKDFVALFIYYNFNDSLSSSSFPTGLKYAHVKPTFNYSLTSIIESKEWN